MANRRTFIKTSAALSLGAALSPLSCGIPEDHPYMKDIGLQLWSVRDLFDTNPKTVLKAVAESGYKMAETHYPSQYIDHKDTFDGLGLAVRSSHISWKHMFEDSDKSDLKPLQQKNFDQFLEVVHKEGFTHLVVAWLPDDMQNEMDNYRHLIDEMNKKGELCRKAGIKLAYHNHNFEFKDIDGTTPFQLMIDRFDPDNVKFELDVFWSSVAGIEPVGLMKQLKDRICLLHLKDKLGNTPVSFTTGEVPHESYKELGNGVVNIQGVIDAAPEAGVDYCLVEQDHSPDILESIKVSMKYLNA